MSLSVRTRFEVFKRDGFRCSYCGRRAPDVLLQADHIVPVSRGGADEIENLTTACSDCNLGKSDVPLGEATPTVSADAVADAAERLDQARAYAEHVASLRAIDDKAVWMVTEAWAVAFGAMRTMEDGAVTYRMLWSGERFPNGASIRRVLRKVPLAAVLEAVDIAASRFEHAYPDVERYFFGTCWRKLDDIEGKARR